MTNPQTPQYPEGTPPAAGQQQPPFAPPQQAAPAGSPQQGPYAPPSPYAQQPYAPQGQYSQQQGQYPSPQQQYAPQPPAPRQARPKTDPNGVPYGIGPFTLREVVFLSASALVLISSFLPFVGGDYAEVFGYTSAWSPAPWLAIPAALVLAAAAALLVLRRLAPARPLRVGSLSVDQFASAASVVTAGFYLGAVFLIVGFTAWFGGGSEALVPGAGVVLGLLFSLLAVVVTTVAPAIPAFRSEFSARRETAAHPVARPASVVPIRPRAERPAAPQPQAGYYPGQQGAPMQPAGPGEYAAYQRRGSLPAPLETPPVPVADQRTPEPLSAPAVFPGAAAAPVAQAPTTAPDRVEGPGAEPAVGAPMAESAVDAHRAEPAVEAPSAEDGVDVPGVDHEVGEDRDATALGGSRQRADAPDETQAFAPGFVATDIPAVDPDGAAATPLTDDDRIDGEDDDLDEDGSAEPAPVSAFSHVSARAAAGSAGAEADDAESPTTVFSTQPFWVYSPVPRPVVDEQTGATVFEIGPTAWALAIVDRGTELVIRHDDGRVGVLIDLEGITRG